LEIQNKLIKSCICSTAVCGSEMRTVGENEEALENGFETWCWRRTSKIKWTERKTNGGVFQRANKERLLLIIFKK
jgi:hypothetical protein